MQAPDRDAAKKLLEWSPPLGVLSVYVGIDPGDRGGRWRIEVGDAIKEALAGTGDAGHELRIAARATAEALAERFGEEGSHTGRGRIGFIELSGERQREERWYTTQVGPRRTQAGYGRRPLVRPLVELLDEGRRLGVVVISGERGRMLEWELGTVTELDEMEMVTSGDWRERKAPQPSGQVRGVTSSAGRDQHEQRVGHSAGKFVRDVAQRAGELRASNGWDSLVVFGEGEPLSVLVDSLGSNSVRAVQSDVINEDRDRIASRLEEIIPALNRDRELALIDRVEDAAQAGGRGALGAQETAQALAEARVEHLLLDAGRDFSGLGIERAFASEGGEDGGLAPGELLVESALRSGAHVTPVEDEAAARLDGHEGVAAILRYSTPPPVAGPRRRDEAAPHADTLSGP